MMFPCAVRQIYTMESEVPSKNSRYRHTDCVGRCVTQHVVWSVLHDLLLTPTVSCALSSSRDLSYPYFLLSSNVPGKSVRELWTWAPFFDLCQNEDILRPWLAVSVVSNLLVPDERRADASQ